MKRILLTLLLVVLAQTILVAHPGIGLVFDGKQTIYYTDLEHIWAVDTKNGVSTIFIENVHSHELWLDENGNLFGEHYWFDEQNNVFKHYIWRSSPEGELEKISDTKIGENDHFSFVRQSFEVSYSMKEEDNFISIEKTTPDTSFTITTLELAKPSWLFLLNDSTLLLSGLNKIERKKPLYQLNLVNNELKILLNDLSGSSFPFSLQDDAHHVYGIWEDDLSNKYVALYGARRVIRINSANTIEQVLKTSFFWSPVNGVFDSDNKFWLLESSLTGNVRIRNVELPN